MVALAGVDTRVACQIAAREVAYQADVVFLLGRNCGGNGRHGRSGKLDAIFYIR